MARFSGVDGAMRELRGELKKLEKEAVAETQRAGKVVTEAMFSRTPVWEGTSVRNFKAGIGAPAGGGETPPIEAGPPGPTNIMSIGEEPRRGPNEAAARAEINGVLAGLKKLANVYFTNTAAHFDLVDAGRAPGAPNQRIRNPGGVMMLAQQLARAKLGGLWK